MDIESQNIEFKQIWRDDFLDMPYETATFKRISRTAVDYFLNHAVRAFRMPSSALTDSTETVLENLNLITDDGKLRNAAILLFAENPQRYFPGSEFKIGRFGTSESDFMFQDEKMRRPEFEFTCGGLNTIIYRKNVPVNDTIYVPVNDTVNLFNTL